MGRIKRRFGSLLLALSLSLALSSCGDSSMQMYETENVAPSYKNMSLSGIKQHMGATVVDHGVNFLVFSKNATRMEVLLFDDPESSSPTMRIPLTRIQGSDYWSVYVDGIGEGQYYGYIAWGPNWPYVPTFRPGSADGFISDCDDQGNRFNPNKLLIDPYTRRIHRDFDWGKGNPASGTARDISTWGAAAKSVVIKSKHKWSDAEIKWRENRQKGDAFEGHAVNDAIYYEVHPKGFTAKSIHADMTAPGTWRGIGEMAPYLKDLGITAVELMPVGEKPDDGTYWGYNTIAFFAPEQRFAYNQNKKDPAAVVDEFKQMVEKLHENGIEVILDVVFNHTGEGGFWRSRVQSSGFSYGDYSNFDDKTAATIYSWRGLDNASYYHLIDGKDGKPNTEYLDQTGVGNQLRTNVEPFRQFILDNLRYWVEEMHVDGFRFDLASILGVDDQNVYGDNAYWFNNVKNTVLQDIIDDEVFIKNHTRMIAEPWDIGHYAIGGFPSSTKKEGYAWSEWNGRFRDMIRRLIKEDGYMFNSRDSIAPNWENRLDVGNILTGSSVLYGDDGRKPYHSVNFITAHDGFTLYDLATYWGKENDCGKLNPICCDQAYNAFCDRTSGEENNESRNWCQAGDDLGYSKGSDGTCNNADSEAYKRQIIRNYFVLLLMSNGSPMILGGDEYMRVQYGNNNAYSDSADNEYNWFRWGDWLSDNNRIRMHDFVRNVIKVRKKFRKHLAPMTYDEAGKVQWWGSDDSGGSSEAFWNSRSLAMYHEAKEDTPALFIILNMDGSDKSFTLPASEKPWQVLIDTQRYYDSPDYLNAPENAADSQKSYNVVLDGSRVINDGKYSAKERSIVVLTNE